MVLIAVNNFQDNSLGAYELPEGSLIIDLKVEIEGTEGVPISHQRLLRKQNDSQDLKDNENLDSLTSDGSSKAIIYLVQAQIFYHLVALPGGVVRHALFRLMRAAKLLKVKLVNRGPPFKAQKWLIGRNKINMSDKVFGKHCKRRGAGECEPSNPESEMGIPINLDEPVRACLLWETLDRYYKIDPSATNISVLGCDGRPTFNISDLDRSFSYHGVCNGDTLHITYVALTREGQRGSLLGFNWQAFRVIMPALMNGRSGRHDCDGAHSLTIMPGGAGGGGTIVCAKYDWNGEIMHPNLKGLSLKHTALFTVSKESFKQHDSPGWLYGSPVYPSEVRLSGLFTRRVEGYFPENFVSPVHCGVTTEQHPEVTSTDNLDVPLLPPFHFPPASRMTFRMPIGDKGHSFLKFTANYECVSSPVDPTHVTISLLCTTHDIRRISAVSVFIMIPESALLDVQVCENEAHQKEIHTDKEVTQSRLKGKHFDGINIGTCGTAIGFQGGVSKSYTLDNTEKGQRVLRRKITAGIDKEDTICWNLKAPASKLDEDGLDGEESITLVLKKKPVEFKYKCRVTHARNGIEKTTQRITDNKPWEFFSL